MEQLLIVVSTVKYKNLFIKGQMKTAYRLENLKGKNHLEDFNRDGMIILEWIIEKSGGRIGI
jgi:hypothetical protein